MTMTGALPPSSRWVRFRLRTAAWSTFWPVAMSPVSETIRTFWWEVSGAPTDSPRPATTLTTPAGNRSARVVASLRAVSGVCSDGFITTVLPAAIAGATFQASIIRG